ncbi:TadE/TadG family type IV pilus assembly protein [Amycolatopsis sp. NPDC059657]|uniref:TadE/TadG family type IV pilus assembly protein n=1 Tax=Amycolatopsis sp. NPDC059657 TaxID=3346899 RepID=UPI00366FD17E
MDTDDSGSETVAAAILFALALLLVLSIVQAGLWWHARDLVSTAAQEGADAARTLTGTTTHGQDTAASFLRRAGDGMLSDPAVHATGDTTRVQVSVSAAVLQVLPIPGLDLRVSATAHAAKERWTTPGGLP